MRKILHLALSCLLAALPMAAAQGIGGKAGIGGTAGIGRGATGIATLVQSAGNSQGGPGTPGTVSVTGVVAGDLLVFCGNWTSSPGSNFVSVTDGTNAFTPLTITTDTTSDYGIAAYQLSAIKSGSVTYDINFSGPNGQYIESVIYEFHTSLGTWHYDASNQNGANFTTSVTTGTIATTGTDEAITFCNKLSSIAATASNPLINGVTPVEASFSPLDTYSHYYYYLPTAPFTGGQGTLTYSTNTNWVSTIAAFSAY